MALDNGKILQFLDSPGHKMYLPQMIQAAQIANAGVLVVSAREGEFESGFEKGGQTKEHLMILNMSGVQEIIVVVNKMDECGYSRERFDYI